MNAIVRWGQRNLLGALVMALAIPAIGLTQGCDDGTAPGLAEVKIQLTDAPADAIASAVVWISRVYLQGCAEGEEGVTEECTATDLYNDPENSKEYDLLTLQDGGSADLTGFVPVEATVYHQLRFVVDSARVTLAEGYTFANPGDPANVAVLKVPSGDSSGIKVHLDQAIDAESEATTVVLVDFDVADNFVLQGAGQDTVITGVVFTPTLREKGRSHQSN